MIEGGWNFVWSAFAISWLGLLSYGLYLFFAATSADDESQNEG